MAKRKKNIPEVNDMLFSLNFVYNTIECYGNENDYSHDLMIEHLNDVLSHIEKQKANKLPESE